MEKKLLCQISKSENFLKILIIILLTTAAQRWVSRFISVHILITCEAYQFVSGKTVIVMTEERFKVGKTAIDKIFLDSLAPQVQEENILNNCQ